MEKLYDRIDWHNNTSPDINENNLNRMSKALDDLDDRVILIAGDVLVTVPELQEMLEDCTELEQRLEAMTENPPYIGENGHWYIWDTDTGAYVDSGIDASITVEIADITMLEPNATPYVTNTGTDTDPIFHLFIPRGQPGKGISSIAKTGTSGYVDTYTITYTDGTSTTYTVTNGRNTDQMPSIPAADASLVGTIYQYIGASTSSYTHGFYYECVNDGGVYKWVNIPVGNDPVEITSTDPYTYRQGKGNLADMEIVGASVGWNQLVQNGDFASGTNWTARQTNSLSIANNEATITTVVANNTNSIYQSNPTYANHVYLCCMDLKKVSGNFTRAEIGFCKSTFVATTNYTVNITTNYAKYSSILKPSEGGDRFYFAPVTNVSIGDKLNAKNVNVIDLTALFGSTVADAIYAMEQATAGAGVAFFRKYFPKDYYAYDPGSIQSVCIASRKVVGFNQWDEEWEVGGISTTTGANASESNKIRSKNINPCLPNTVYFLGGKINNVVKISTIFWYDASGGFISFDYNTENNGCRTSPSNAYYFRILGNSAYGTTYNHDICINISDASRNGTYEPYTSTAYPFDSTKELRGPFILDGGELKASGDVWRGDEIQRKYREQAFNGTGVGWTYTYQKGDYSWFSTTSGTNCKASSICICDKFSYISTAGEYEGIYVNNSGAIVIGIKTSKLSSTDTAGFNAWLASNNTTVVYELATPTTEAAQPYQNPQRAYIDGTEEFTDGLTRDVMIPVGNNSVYQQDKVLPSIEDYVDAVAEVVKADILTTTNEEENVDLDTLTTPGMYFVKNSDAGSYNYPSSVTSGVLTVIHYKQNGETMIRQELWSANYLCYRNGMWSNGSWVFGAGWFVFTGTN